MLPEEYRPRVMTQNGLVLGSVLVDGLVAGSWRLVEERSGARSLTVRPFGAPLDPADRRAALAEAERVLAFAGGGDGEVRFEDAE